MSKNQKKIWITGASSGIGKALAEKFTKEGWKVAISARRKEILNQIADNKNIFSFPLDVTIEEDCKKTFKEIIQKFDYIDICFFCSGAYDPNKEKEINLKNDLIKELKDTSIYKDVLSKFTDAELIDVKNIEKEELDD